MSELPKVIIYTDGACDPNPGPGGWAALLKFGPQEKILTGVASDSTNNRMELTAAIQGLEALSGPYQIQFFTDSEYVKKGITEWMPGWKARNWRRKGGQLANIDLWKRLDQVIQPHKIDWRWVRGHAGNRDNNRVDRLARQAIRK